VIEEVEHQRVQHLQGGGADGASVVAGLVCASVEVPGAVPEAHSGLLGHRDEPDGVGDATGPDRPGRLSGGTSGLRCRIVRPRHPPPSGCVVTLYPPAPGKASGSSFAAVSMSNSRLASSDVGDR
jgi:hypothetical protein